jgi:DNA replication protein DnaC
MGLVTKNVSIHHPDFGKAFPCPLCGGGAGVQARQRDKLRGYFGLSWLYGSRKLTQHTVTDFLELEDYLAVGKGKAIEAAYDWAHGHGAPFIVLSGRPGVGKTCLASAAFLTRTGEAVHGLPIEYNAMMDVYLGMIDASGDNVALAVRAASRVPVLLLDDLGNTFVSGAETPGRQRWLFEVINYRYNQGMPSIVTTNLSADGLYRQFDEKLIDRLLERAAFVVMEGASLRFVQADLGSYAGRGSKEEAR